MAIVIPMNQEMPIYNQSGTLTDEWVSLFYMYPASSQSLEMVTRVNAKRYYCPLPCTYLTSRCRELMRGFSTLYSYRQSNVHIRIL